MGIGSAMAGGNPANGREDRDFYPTPVEVTLALLNAEKFEGAIFEPACGNGAIGRIFEDAGHKVVASDIHPLGYGVKRDFFTVTQKLPNANIVTNPPFNLARQFIEHALSLEPRSLALVLKGSYWHAANRLELFERTKPSAIYPLSWRPDFLGLGRPTMEVCWTVWRRDHEGPTVYRPLEKPDAEMLRSFSKSL
jgi:hypothetical protein